MTQPTTLTLRSAVELLRRHHLLREIITSTDWTMDADDCPCPDEPFTDVTYDTRKVKPGTLLFIKGQFRTAYLDAIDDGALGCYVAETDYSAHTKATGLIVDNVHQAMYVLGMAYYGRPQDGMTLIGLTGTKGKTTTNYLVHAILNAYSDGHAALLSSIGNCLDGRTFEPAHLTTPEPLDLFRMMRRAADNGMRYFVMEVSSQAYKIQRVYGLVFDVGGFLNISPDHISPIEHPTFEDYFHCKRQIIPNSRRLVLGADCDHLGLLLQDAAEAGRPVTTFALDDAHEDGDGRRRADVTATPLPDGTDGFEIDAYGTQTAPLRLRMSGEVNYANAAAAVALATQAGVPADSPAIRAMESVQVPGRMERIDSADGIIGYVDFAHNYISIKSLVDEVERLYGERDPHIILVAGSTGGKALDRREGIVRGALGRVESFIFTLDDPNFEDPRSIAEEMASHVTDPDATVRVIIPRHEAIEAAVEDARSHPDRLNVVLVTGKGHERRNIIDGRPVPYDGDANVLRRCFGRLADRTDS